MAQSFGEWLNQQLTKRDMKPADLARAAGVDNAVISHLLNEKRNPGVDSSKAISRALNIPLEEVYRAANILPPKPETDILIDTVIHFMLEMNTADKEDVLEYVKLRHKLATDKETLNKRNPKRGNRRVAQT